jgi:hypothetical protein
MTPCSLVHIQGPRKIVSSGMNACFQQGISNKLFSLFNDTDSSSNYLESNDRAINK